MLDLLTHDYTDWTISARHALRLIEEHGASLVEFDEEVKPNEQGRYNGLEVMSWLGY